MSTIVTNNIVLPDASSSIGVSNLSSNSLIAWVCYYHSSATLTVRGKCNVSSVTYVASGKHYITLPFAVDSSKIGFNCGYSYGDIDVDYSAGCPMYPTNVGVHCHACTDNTSRINVTTFYTASNQVIASGLVFVGIYHNSTGG